MPTNILLTEEEEIKFEEGGGLKPETLYYRKEMLSPFICFMLIIVMVIKLRTFIKVRRDDTQFLRYLPLISALCMWRESQTQEGLYII